ILAQKQDTTNPVYNQVEKEIPWEQISQQGEELAEKLEAGFGKATELIQELELVAIPMETIRMSSLDKENQPISIQRSKGPGPLNYVPYFLPPERAQSLQSEMSE
ncbi:unnamed protein product, partial [Onchocerca ochengi]